MKTGETEFLPQDFLKQEAPSIFLTTETNPSHHEP